MADTFRLPYAVAPGETLAEALRERGIEPEEFATRIGCSWPSFVAILRGEAAITSDVASRLEAVLAIPAGFWLTREEQYRDALASGAPPMEEMPLARA